MLTVNQIAKQLSISRGTVVNLIKAGSIKAIKVGEQYRIHEDKFNQFVTACEYNPKKTNADSETLTI